MKSYVLGLVAAAALAAPAHAAITVDGTRDADYGAKKSTLTAPYGSESVTYDIYLTSQDSGVYGFLQANRDISALPFANLYFNLDPQNGTSTDLGFEVTNRRAFIPTNPGTGIYGAVPEIAFTLTSTAIEFMIPLSAFTSQIAGLTYYSDTQLPTAGGDIVLTSSQSFSYSRLGNSASPDRLGRVTLAAVTAPVPEPATWAMMIAGFGLVGAAMRTARRRARTSVTFA